MPRIEIPNRFLFDSAFYTKVIKKNPRDELIWKLMYINARSKLFERKQNCMSRKVFETLANADVERGDTQDQARAILKTSFHAICEPEEIEAIEDEIERNIKYAIRLAEGMPAQTIIFTSEDIEQKYLQNPHYITAKTVVIKSNADAINLIKYLYDQTLTD